MKPTATIDLEEYNELKRRSQELALGVKTITFSVKVIEGNDAYINGFDYVPSRYKITDSFIQSSDEAVNAIAEELKKARKELGDVRDEHNEGLSKVKKECDWILLKLKVSHSAEIASIKKMSLFQFYRFKNNK